MQEIYKDCVIEYSEYNGEFIAKIGDSEYRNKELQKCRDKIDIILKPKFERVNVLRANCVYSKGMTTSFTSVDITSQDKDDFWVITKDNRRSKEPKYKLYIKNQHNEAIINDLLDCEKEIKKIKETMEITFTKLIQWEPKAGAN